MRNKLFIFFAVLLFAGKTGYSQNDIKKLTMPSSPAFSILNYEPTAVMKPTSNKDLATDILNSFDKDGKLLMNLGLEVSPYWLQSRPYVTREKYLNPDALQAFLQSFSLSAATVKDSVSGTNKLGAGFRFKVINGRPAMEQQEADKVLAGFNKIQADITAVKSLSAQLKTVDTAISFIKKTMTKQSFPSATIDKIVATAQKIAANFPDTQEGITAFADSLVNIVNDTKSDAALSVATLTKQRLGFILEFAGASAFVPNSTNNTDGLERIGVWMNMSNYVSATDLFTLTTRYMYSNGDTTMGNFDAGLSYMKKSDKYNISIEYMLRWYNGQTPDINLAGQPIKRTISDFSYRLAVQGSYLVSDQISVNISIGKNFDAPLVTGNGYFSILGLNYSIFNNEKVNTKNKP